MATYVRHIALVVPDLREAEAYYRSLFDMDLIGRETQLEDGRWYSLPAGMGWEEAEGVGVEVKMLALRKGDIVLALFPGPQPPGQVFAIGLAMPGEQVDGVRKRLPAEAEVLIDRSDQFNFFDRYGIRWQLVPPGNQFEMNEPLQLPLA